MRITLPIITNETMNTLAEFNEKIEEELLELSCGIGFYKAFEEMSNEILAEKYRRNIIEEYYDVVQVLTQKLYFIGITQEEIENYAFLHHKKLFRRGWELDER